MELPNEEDLIRSMRAAILAEDGVEAAGEFDAWVQHMKTAHPNQPLFVIMHRPRIRYRITLEAEGGKTYTGEVDAETEAVEQDTVHIVPTQHQRTMKTLWERFRATTDAHGFEHAPVLGEEGWQQFWQEAIQQREVHGLEQLLPRLDVQWRDRAYPRQDGQEDAYSFLAAEIDGLSGNTPEHDCSANTEEREYWNKLLENIEGL